MQPHMIEDRFREFPEAYKLQQKSSTVAGVRQTSHHSRTAKGDMILSLTIENLQETLDVVLSPDMCRVARSLLDSNPSLLITGVMGWTRSLRNRIYGRKKWLPFPNLTYSLFLIKRPAGLIGVYLKTLAEFAQQKRA